jgi:excisionase family DNA binding protein
MSGNKDVHQNLFIGIAPLLTLQEDLKTWEDSVRRFAPDDSTLAIIQNFQVELENAIRRGRSMRRYMTVAEAAEEYDLSERQIRNLISTGELAAQKIGGVWRIDATESESEAHAA